MKTAQEILNTEIDGILIADLINDARHAKTKGRSDEPKPNRVILNPWTGKHMKNSEFDIYLAIHGRQTPFIGPLTLKETVRSERILAGREKSEIGNIALNCWVAHEQIANELADYGTIKELELVQV